MSISIQYPLIEALIAILFAATFWLDYYSQLRPHFFHAGLAATWPAFIMQLVLIAALIASTVIDARYYIIPIRIPHLVTLAALILLPFSAIGLPHLQNVVPIVGAQGVGAAVGGVIGLSLALLLLHFKLLPRSFDEVEEVLEQSAPKDAFLSHPHPRREVLKECLFVAMPMVGALLGSALMYVPQNYIDPTSQYPLGIRIFAGVLAGYLIGGGVVWSVRILGTLAFGREAMGLGDVHLLAAIGAVMGWRESIMIFFIAPFLGLIGTAIVGGVQRVWKSQGRVIPYGPYLAAAAIVVMAFRQPLWEFFGIF